MHVFSWALFVSVTNLPVLIFSLFSIALIIGVVKET